MLFYQYICMTFLLTSICMSFYTCGVGLNMNEDVLSKIK